MKILHTSDWHVGKTIRGRSRADEHREVLAEIVDLSATNDVDLVIVAGDLYDTASPNAESERIVYDALLALKNTGADVVVIVGNHDSAPRFGAVAPVFDALGVRIASKVRRPSEGGVIDVTTRRGERARIALLPFLSQRDIVRADLLMAAEGHELAQTYATRYAAMAKALTATMEPDMVNVLVAHAYIDAALSGGGERTAHLTADYALAASVFPSTLHYVALGHLHRAQRVGGAAPTHYCGSPLQLDFGETDQTKQVNLIDATPGMPAKVRACVLHRGRALRRVRGTLADLAVLAPELGDAWVRVELHEPARAGLADEVRALVPNAVDVITLRDAAIDNEPPSERRLGKTPQELFATYCAERGYDDPRARALFAELLEDSYATAAD